MLKRLLLAGCAIAAVASACRTRTSSDAQLLSADTAEDDKHSLVVEQKAAEPTSFRVAFFLPDKVGPAAKVRWGVRSRTSLDGEPACDKLTQTATVTVADETMAAPPGMLNAPNHSFMLTIDPKVFDKPREADPGAYKISLAMQKSGYFNGPMQLEVCVTDASKTTSGWGIPVMAKTVGAKGANLIGPNSLPDVDDPVAYGKLCAQRLGPLPPFDCRNGEIIPITVDGVEVEFGKHTPNMPCDKPAYLGLSDQGSCVPYARLGRLDTGKPDVDTVYICRRYKIGEMVNNAIPAPRGADVALHEDVAIVQHNRVTGETCFFQALAGFQPDHHSLPTRRVPPPTEDALPPEVVRDNLRHPVAERVLAAKEFWIKPGDMENFACSKCHDSDPYMMSPHVMQVARTLPDGTKDFMLPCDPAAPGQIAQNTCHAKDGKGLYKLLSRLHNAPNWRPTRAIAPKDPSAQACVSCHRVGSINTCDTWATDSAGRGDVQGGYRTPFSKSFAQAHWMPLFTAAYKFGDKDSAHGLADAASWDAQYKKSADALLECCNLRGKAGFDTKCTMSPITQRPPTFNGSGENAANHTIVFTTATSPSAIPDKASVTLALTPSVTVEQADLTYSATAKLSIRHDYIGQLKVSLRKGGPVAGDGSINFDEFIPLEPDIVLFDGAKSRTPAARSLELTLTTDQDDSPLKALLGAPVAGTWQLIVEDTQTLEKGQVDKFELAIDAAQ